MSVVPDFQSCDSWLPIKNADTCTCARNVIMLARARSFAGEEVWNVRWVLNVLLSLLEMILRGLCKTIYQGLRGLCIYGSNSRSSAQIVLRETPTVLSKRPRSLSMQRSRKKLRSFQFQNACKSSSGSKQANWVIAFQGHHDYMISANAINIGACGTSVINFTLGMLHVWNVWAEPVKKFIINTSHISC